MNDWFAEGALAEYCVTRPEWIANKPRVLSHEEAASVPISALTAWQGSIGARPASAWRTRAHSWRIGSSRHVRQAFFIVEPNRTQLVEVGKLLEARTLGPCRTLSCLCPPPRRPMPGLLRDRDGESW